MNSPTTGRFPSGMLTGVGNGARFLIIAASLIIVIAGLREAREIIVLLLFAAVLALICIRPIRYLQAWGVPKWLAIIFMVVVVLVALVGLSVVIGSSITDFSGNIEQYRKGLNDVLDRLLAYLGTFGLNVSREDVTSTLDSGDVLVLISDTTESLLGVLSDLAVIILIMVFMLIEADGLPDKLQRAFGKSEEDIEKVKDVTDLVYGFLSIKTGLNLVVGGLVAGFTAILEIDYPLLWGLVAFVFNFVPNIGSVIAAIPPALLALVDEDAGLGTALVVVAGFVTINTVIGNIIEPRLMGRHLGLSPLVVIVSLIVWNWILGPVGMLLSLPLTMVVKVVLENSEDLRFAGVMLGPAHEPDDGSP